MKKSDIIKKVNRVLLWLLLISFIGAVAFGTNYAIDTYYDNRTYTLNVNNP